MEIVEHQRVKLLIAGAAAIALVAVAAVAAGQQATETVTGSRMNVGETETTTTPPAAPPTPIAHPVMRADRPRGY